MRRNLLPLAAVLVAGVAFAANAHFIGAPSVTQNNRQLIN